VRTTRFLVMFSALLVTMAICTSVASADVVKVNAHLHVPGEIPEGTSVALVIVPWRQWSLPPADVGMTLSPSDRHQLARAAGSHFVPQLTGAWTFQGVRCLEEEYHVLAWSPDGTVIIHDMYLQTQVNSDCGDFHFQLTFTVSQSDSDGDGVPDTEDQCPDQPGNPANNGCPVVEDGETGDGDNGTDDGAAKDEIGGTMQNSVLVIKSMTMYMIAGEDDFEAVGMLYDLTGQVVTNTVITLDLAGVVTTTTSTTGSFQISVPITVSRQYMGSLSAFGSNEVPVVVDVRPAEVTNVEAVVIARDEYDNVVPGVQADVEIEVDGETYELELETTAPAPIEPVEETESEWVAIDSSEMGSHVQLGATVMVEWGWTYAELAEKLLGDWSRWGEIADGDPTPGLQAGEMLTLLPAA